MKDLLLSPKFFSSFGSEEDLREAIKRENTEISALIKQVLYPQAKEAIYYNGQHNNPADLVHFIQGSEYAVLQKQFDIVITKLKQWGKDNIIQALETLDTFSSKLKTPSDRVTILYGDGKKHLETIAVLLLEPAIDLELRKTIFTNLLADNELAKCIDGCYMRIANTAKFLQENRENANQINRWTRSYTTETARKIAATRPFAMPESYQRLICRALDISVEANELHTNNYLLAQAKSKGMLVEINSDFAALEIAHKVEHLNKRAIVDFYLKALESEISATGLVGFIEVRLYNSINTILSDTSKDYMEKVSAIENKLNLVGKDKDFLLEEILDVELLSLKPKASLSITIVKRLTDKKWLSDIGRTTQVTVSQKTFFYHHFPNNFELDWFVEEGKTSRFRFLDLLLVNNFALRDPIQERLLATVLLTPQLNFEVNDINKILKYNSLPIPAASLFSLDRIANLLKANPDPLLFTNFLHKLSSPDRNFFLQKLSKIVVDKIIVRGLNLAKVEVSFKDLKPEYFIRNYNSIAQEDALKVTKHILRTLLENGQRDFRNLGFLQLKYTNYFTDLDFSNCDLRNTFILQSVSNCKFDNSLLESLVFTKKLEKVSFFGTDLRKSFFIGGNYFKYSELDLSQARLSRRVFEDLLLADVTDFTYTNLKEVVLRNIRYIQRLKLDFSHADLQSTNLKELDLRNSKFYGANLQKANLLGCYFNSALLDKYVRLEAAYLDMDTVFRFYTSGERKFDNCKITQGVFNVDNLNVRLESVSFKQANFIKDSFNLKLIDCDLSEEKFIPSNRQQEYSYFANNKYVRTKLVKTEFQRIKFSDITFTDCLVQNIILNDVKMPASTLFTFYQHGHRNFNRVRALKGKIPEKLPPFPLLDASLSKEVFIHLYRQGLRDFRASRLMSFYLRETLTAQAISEIDLKLEGASYKQSLLACVSSQHASHKRSINLQPKSGLRCVFYFLIQKSGLVTEKTVSYSDLVQIATQEAHHGERNLYIKEVTLNHKPLVLLEKPDEIKFFWGYPPDDEALIKVIDFAKQSTYLEDRKVTRIFFYFTKKIVSIDNIKVLASDMRQLGFRQGQLSYFTAQGQFAVLDLEGNPIRLPHYTNLNTRFASVLEDMKVVSSAPKPATKEKPLSQLYRIAADMKRRAKSGFRSGTRQGAQYELGFTLMYFIASWITHREDPTPKELDNASREGLKVYAKQMVAEEADKKFASTYIGVTH